MKILPILLPIISCGQAVQPAATCETFCGLRLQGDLPSAEKYPSHSPVWTCENLQEVERGILAEFPAVNDPRFRDVCPKLKGWVLTIQEKATWKDPVLGELSGLTHCAEGFSEIGNVPPDRSSLPHEIAHVVQGCFPNDCAHPGTDPVHWCWRQNGVFAAAAAANLEAGKRMPIPENKDGG